MASRFVKCLGGQNTLAVAGFVYGAWPGSWHLPGLIKETPLASVALFTMFGFVFSFGATLIGELVPFPWIIPPILLISLLLKEKDE